MANPIEIKYHKLARSSLARGLADRELKPNTAERNKIAAIINNPSKHITGTERQLLWAYRYSLVEDKRVSAPRCAARRAWLHPRGTGTHQVPACRQLGRFWRYKGGQCAARESVRVPVCLHRRSTAQALDLLQQWAPIDIADALELLSSQFQHAEVRKYAVRQLEQRADDDVRASAVAIAPPLPRSWLTTGCRSC
jgi:phosphatidylinositol 3-kinase